MLGVRLWASEHDVRQAHSDFAKAWHPARHEADPRLSRKAGEKLKQADTALEVIASAGFPGAEPRRLPEPSWTGQQPPNQGHQPSWQGQRPHQHQPPPWQGQQQQQGWHPHQQQPPAWHGQPAPPWQHQQTPWQGPQGSAGSHSPPYPQSQRTAPASSSGGGGWMVLFGLVLIVVGIAISLGTYDAAVGRGGGYYFIAGGPIIMGIRSIFRGLKS